MQNNVTRKLVLCALFIALIFVVTYWVKSPVSIGGAYINAGDAFIYTAGVAMSGPWAALAAGLGSMLADLLGGAAAVYAPGTLVIKAAMGLIVGLALYARKASVLRYIAFMAVSSLVMVLGYGLYELVLYGFAVMLANMPLNLIQAAGGVVLGVPLALLVRRILPETWLEAFRKPEK